MAKKSHLKVIARFRNSMVHFYNGGELICSTKNRIYRITNLDDPKMELLSEIPWKLTQHISHFRIADRYLGNSILRVHKTRYNKYLVTTGKKWWRIDSKGNISSIDKFSETRPMSRGICESKSGVTYIAEYTPNPHRGSVKIFYSKDLKNFDIAWEFPPGSIAHVHALVVDPESDKARGFFSVADYEHSDDEAVIEVFAEKLTYYTRWFRDRIDTSRNPGVSWIDDLGLNSVKPRNLNAHPDR